MHWHQVDFERKTVRVGKSKTEAGTGRTIPLNTKATEVLKFWSERFSEPQPEHFALPSERYGAGGNKFEPTAYDLDPDKPINSFKEAWESAKESAKVKGSPSPHRSHVNAGGRGSLICRRRAILGWSPATTVRMAKRYGDIGQVAQRQAVDMLSTKAQQPKKSNGKII